MEYQFLIDEAFKSLQNAYAPYSNFKVGAVLITKNGKLFRGCNIENAAYGSTMCAERIAIFSAIASGVKSEEIEALAIVAKASPLAAPCGNCRQVISEFFLPDTPIILANHLNEYQETTIKELLPYAFSKEQL